MTALVGILNLTPDSFSGDGVASDVASALARADAMVKAGASVIDVGAESTRPGAKVLSPSEEWSRLEAVLPELAARLGSVPLSVDTRHPQTAMQALEASAGWINDVNGARDTDMFALLRDSRCRIVLMHALSVPADPAQVLPPDADPLAVILAWGEERLAACASHGIARERIILDPGIGFGKTAAQSWRIIDEALRLKTLGVPILIGHSRKSFLLQVTDRNASDRDAQTLAVSRMLIEQGIDYLRVHDVAGHAALLKEMQ